MIIALILLRSGYDLRTLNSTLSQDREDPDYRVSKYTSGTTYLRLIFLNLDLLFSLSDGWTMAPFIFYPWLMRAPGTRGMRKPESDAGPVTLMGLSSRK